MDLVRISLLKCIDMLREEKLGSSSGVAEVAGQIIEPLARHLERNGLAIEEVARKAGVMLPPADGRYDRYLPMNDVACLLQQAGKLLDDPLIGLRSSVMEPVVPTHALVLALPYAPTLRRLFEVLGEAHASIVDLEACEVRQVSGRIEVIWRHVPRVVLRDQLNDCIAMLTCMFLSLAAGPDCFKNVAVRLERGKPEDTRLHRQCFGPNVQFDQNHSAISLPVELADKPLPGAYPVLFDALVELAMRRLADRGRLSGITALVSEEIARRVGEKDLSLESVARAVGVSGRVLQRRLSEQGVTFHELHDDVRRGIAADLLRTTGLPISEVSFRLGFSAVGNFTRAAKRWFGVTPSDWRRTEAHR